MDEAMFDRVLPLPDLVPVGKSGPGSAGRMSRPPRGSGRRRGMQPTERDVWLLAWIGEQYTVRADLLAVLMARASADPQVRERGRVSARMAERRIQSWREAGLVQSRIILHRTSATVWLTGDGYRFAGLDWRTYDPTEGTAAHRHAVGLVRAAAEATGAFRWTCERDLREGMAGRPTHLPDGVVESFDEDGRLWRTAVEVELSRKTEARVSGIIRRLLVRYDDVVYHAVADAGAVVERAAAGIDGAADRVHVRRYPPASLADIA